MRSDYREDRELHDIEDAHGDHGLAEPIQISEPLPSDILIQRCGDVVVRSVVGGDRTEDVSGEPDIAADLSPRQHSTDPYDDPRFGRWLEQQARVRQSPRERGATACVAASFAVRLRRQTKIARTRTKIPIMPLHVRDADVFGTVGQVAKAAAKVRCAPWLDTMAVAAGVGREVWDEPCERWVELPKGVPRAGYVALNVAGDSMTPVLVAGDVLLVKVGTRAREGALVVARHPDDGYVVKSVGSLSKEKIELESFNPNYASFKIANDCAFVVGTVSYILRYDRGIT